MRGNRRRLALLIVCLLIATGLIYAFLSSGDAGLHKKDTAQAHVMENHTGETGALNAVTAIYLNYRWWDTLFEALVLLVSVLAVINFSWSGDRGPKQ